MWHCGVWHSVHIQYTVSHSVHPLSCDVYFATERRGFAQQQAQALALALAVALAHIAEKLHSTFSHTKQPYKLAMSLNMFFTHTNSRTFLHTNEYKQSKLHSIRLCVYVWRVRSTRIALAHTHTHTRIFTYVYKEWIIELVNNFGGVCIFVLMHTHTRRHTNTTGKVRIFCAFVLVSSHTRSMTTFIYRYGACIYTNRSTYTYASTHSLAQSPTTWADWTIKWSENIHQSIK